MNLSAWRPLKDAPKVWGVIVVRGLGMDRVAMYREGDGEDIKRWRVFNEPEISPLIESLWEYAPIADTLELDRAVQGEVARAFGALLNALVEDERQRIYAAKDGGDGDCYQLFGRHTIRRFASILHTSMGGRIPDEVPR